MIIIKILRARLHGFSHAILNLATDTAARTLQLLVTASQYFQCSLNTHIYRQLFLGEPETKMKNV